VNASDLNDDDLEQIVRLLNPLDLCMAVILTTMLVLLFILPVDTNPLSYSVRQFLSFLYDPVL
jgi:hypothetical protein